MSKSFWDRPLLVLAAVFGIDAVLAAGIVIAVQTTAPDHYEIQAAQILQSDWFDKSASPQYLAKGLAMIDKYSQGSLWLIDNKGNFSSVEDREAFLESMELAVLMRGGNRRDVVDGSGQFRAAVAKMKRLCTDKSVICGDGQFILVIAHPQFIDKIKSSVSGRGVRHDKFPW